MERCEVCGKETDELEECSYCGRLVCEDCSAGYFVCEDCQEKMLAKDVFYY